MSDRHDPELEDPLVDTLRGLPRMKAPQDFTAQVLERIETRRGGRQKPRRSWTSLRRWAPMLAAAMVVLAVAWTARHSEDAEQRRESLARIHAMQIERQALAGELDRLRSLAGRSRPVLYLGTDQGVDLVYDLSRLKQGDQVEIPVYLQDQAQLQKLEDEIPLSEWPMVAPRGMTAFGMPSQIFANSAGSGSASSQRVLY